SRQGHGTPSPALRGSRPTFGGRMRTMRVVLLGDVMLGRLVNQRLKTAAPGFPWGDTLPVLAQADIRFANLECVLADGGTPQPGKVFHFRSDTRNVAAPTARGTHRASL